MRPLTTVDKPLLATLALLSGALAACIPPGETGQCTVDEDCTARGTVCDTVTSTCIPVDKDYNTTAEPSPPVAFQDKAIPFFRGRICSAPMQEVQTGSAIPVTFQPCLHPCISANEYQFHNQYYCSGGTCDGFSVFWSVGSSENCPADAWGEFDPSMCVYDITSNTSIGPLAINGDPIQGFLSYEIPYLTNLDIAAIAEYKGRSLQDKRATATDACVAQCSSSENEDGCLFGCYAKDFVDKYPQQANRVKYFNIGNSSPVPPANCTDDVAACECYDVGF